MRDVSDADMEFLIWLGDENDPRPVNFDEHGNDSQLPTDGRAVAVTPRHLFTGGSAACGGTAGGSSLAPKPEWFEPQVLTSCPKAHPAAPSTAAATEPATPAASGAAAAVAPTQQRRAAACAAVAAAPACGRSSSSGGSGVPQTAPFGFSEKTCSITGWAGPTVAVHQLTKGRTAYVAPLCPCGCGMPPYSEADWASGYLTRRGAPKKDDPNNPRNQPGRQLDTAGLVQHKPMSLRLLAFYHCSPSSATRAGQKRDVPNDRTTRQKKQAGQKSKRRRTA